MFASDIVVDDSKIDTPQLFATAYLNGVATDIEYDGDSHTCCEVNDTCRIPIDPASVIINLS